MSKGEVAMAQLNHDLVLLPNTEVANQGEGAKYGSRCKAQEDTDV